LAVALRDTRLRIALVEHQAPRRPEGWDSRIYAVSPANVAFLDAIGAWKHLDAARMAPIRGMQVQGDAGGEIAFSAYETGVPELAWIIESSLMACEFWETAKRQSNLTMFCPARPQALEMRDEAAVLTLSDGMVLSAQLLVAADGRDSWVREAAGLVAHNTPYGEKGLVANFITERPHQGVAYQWFRDDGVLAYLPLPGNKISIVWSAPDALADEMCGLSEQALADHVADAGVHALGGLSPLTPAAAFPLRLMRVPQTVAPRLALLGDAAHGIHPLSGHGINLGFQDVGVLAEVLGALPAWRDPGELPVLRSYARRRAEEPFLLQYATHGLSRLFGSANPLAAALRNAGMNLTGQLPVLKNALVRYAANGRL